MARKSIKQAAGLIDSVLKKLHPFTDVGGRRHIQDEGVGVLLKEAQEKLEEAFLLAQNPLPPLFEKANWSCQACGYVAEDVEGAPHRCPECLGRTFLRVPDEDEDEPVIGNKKDD